MKLFIRIIDKCSDCPDCDRCDFIDAGGYFYAPGENCPLNDIDIPKINQE
jgi:hypothetical protein